MIVKIGGDKVHFAVNSAKTRYAINLTTMVKLEIIRGINWLFCPDTITVRDQQRLDMEFDGTVLQEKKHSEQDYKEFKNVLSEYLNKYGFPD